MRMTLSLLFVSLSAACTVDAVDTNDPTASQVAASDVHVNPATDLTEPAFLGGKFCKMVFKGGLTPQTEVYEIWAVGTNGIVQGATYNTAKRPNLYAVFGTNTDPSVTHHVDGFNQFDHYHVLDSKDDNTTWDLLTVFPGPNYVAAGYQPARSVQEMNAQIAAGILGPVLTLPEAGFPPVVLNFPVNCPD